MNALERQVHGWLEHFPVTKRMVTLGYQLALGLLPTRTVRPQLRLHKPGFFFGFHDKSPWSADGRHLLAHQISATAKPGQPIPVGLMDPDSGDFAALGETRLWNFQQGSDAQWAGRRACYNTVVDGEHGHCLVDIDTGTRTQRPVPVNAISPDSQTFASYCYTRLATGMSGYGYPQPAASGKRTALRVGSLATGASEEVYAVDAPGSDRHTFLCQTQFSPSGGRLAFFQRNASARDRFSTTMIVLDVNTAKARTLEQLADCSHYTWWDEHRVFAYAKPSATGRWGYVEIDCDTGDVLPVDWLSTLTDGHPQATRQHGLLVSDSYPDRRRLQRLYVFDPAHRRVHELASVRIPLRFSASNRCDFHPRWSPDGTQICIDTAHSGQRSIALLDAPATLA